LPIDHRAYNCRYKKREKEVLEIPHHVFFLLSPKIAAEERNIVFRKAAN
jgi:hypothetical protein